RAADTESCGASPSRLVSHKARERKRSANRPSLQRTPFRPAVPNPIGTVSAHFSRVVLRCPFTTPSRIPLLSSSEARPRPQGARSLEDSYGLPTRRVVIGESTPVPYKVQPQSASRRPFARPISECATPFSRVFPPSQSPG